MRGCVWVGECFLRNDRWQIKLQWIFFQFTYNLWQMTQTQEIIIHRISKTHEWIQGDVYEWAKFLKPWQVTDKIIEWIFMQFIFILWQMTQTQEIINRRGSKIHEWIRGGCIWVGKSFLINDKWQIKLLSESFPIYIQPFTSDSNSRNNNS